MLEEHHALEKRAVEVAEIHRRILEGSIADTRIAEVAPGDAGITETAVLEGSLSERHALERRLARLARMIEIAAVQGSLIEAAVPQGRVLEIHVHQRAAGKVDPFQQLVGVVYVFDGFGFHNRECNLFPQQILSLFRVVGAVFGFEDDGAGFEAAAGVVYAAGDLDAWARAAIAQFKTVSDAAVGVEEDLFDGTAKYYHGL